MPDRNPTVPKLILTFLRLIFYYLFAGERQKRQADFYSTRIFDGVPIVVRGEYTEQTLKLFLTLECMYNIIN
jgi:hypothetical protein